MNHRIHGIGNGGAGGASSYSPQDGASGSAPAPQKEPDIDALKILAAWLDKYGIQGAKLPSPGAFQLFGCQSPFSAPHYPAPQLPKPWVDETEPSKEVETEWRPIEGKEVPLGSEYLGRGFGSFTFQVPEDFEYQERYVPAGKVVFHMLDRTIVGVTPSEDSHYPFKIKDKEYSVPVAGGQWVPLHNNGIPERVNLHQDWEFNEDYFAAGSQVNLKDGGQLTSGIAKPGTVIQGYPIANQYPVVANTRAKDFFIHENGEIRAFVLGEDFTIQGIRFKKNTEINMDDQGRLDFILIREKHTIRGKTYGPHAVIGFDSSGNVDHVYTGPIGSVIEQDY